MQTSRGVRLALIAARGLLKCPSEYKQFHAALIDFGIDTELKKEIIILRMNHAAAFQNVKELEKATIDLDKLLYPDKKSSIDSEMEKLDAQLKVELNKGKTLRVKADIKQTIKSENPLEKFTAK